MTPRRAATFGGRPWRPVAAATLAFALLAPAAGLAATVRSISVDPFTNATSQHQTAVEPDSFAWGSTVVTAFQLGRFYDGAASGIGYATSTDGGQTWTTGVLPGVTKFTSPAGEFDRASDPNVAYDAIHGRWLISILGIHEGSPTWKSAVVVKQSADGRDWKSPAVTVAPSTGAFTHDKNWAACDNAPSSPFRGHCYVSYTDLAHNDAITTQRSTDGGASWSSPVASADTAVRGLGAFPVVRPDGSLVVPYLDASGAIAATRSTDGGASFGNRIFIASVSARQPTEMRAPPLPSVDLDAAGKVFVAWHDCRFRLGCPSAPNDIVYATSPDGVSWSSPVRVPINDASTADHFIPGLAVDPASQGASARIGLTYYFYPQTPCTSESCRLRAGYVASGDGGATWTATETLGGPIQVSWLSSTDAGHMVGDYASTSFVAGGSAVAVVSLAGPFDSSFHQGIFAATIPGGVSPQVPTNAGIGGAGTPSVSLAASRRVVAYGQRVTLFGRVSSHRGNETVEIVRRFRVRTKNDGRWIRAIRPAISASFRARWNGAVSRAVAIGVRPRIELSVQGRRLRIKALSVRSFAGRYVLVQRRVGDRWRTVRRVRLGGSSSATFAAGVAPGSRIRVVLPRRQAGRGYLAGISRPFVIAAR